MFEDTDSEHIKKVGYFAKLAHDQKITKMEQEIASLQAEIQFIESFGDDDPTEVK